MKYARKQRGLDVIPCIRLLREKALIWTSGGNPVYVREGVLHDLTRHIILSVWGDMIDTTEEDNLYCFTQLSLKNYFGRKLATSKMSVTTAHKSRFSNFRWSCLQKLPW